MAVTNHERVGKALDLIKEGLQPFVEREMKAQYSQSWLEQVRLSVAETQQPKRVHDNYSTPTCRAAFIGKHPTPTDAERMLRGELTRLFGKTKDLIREMEVTV